jgi:hypothetical protein
VPTVWKYGSLNLLEPSGTVQACNGIALPPPFYLYRFQSLICVNLDFLDTI